MPVGGAYSSKLALAAVLLVVAVALTACRHDDSAAPGGETAGEADPVDGPPPTAAALSGIWRLGDTNRLVWFGTDGTFSSDNRGRLDTAPAATGTYRIVGDVLAFRNSGSDRCVDGDTWALLTAVISDGRMRTEVVEDADDPCRLGMGKRWTSVRVSPASPGSAEITAAAAEGEGTPPDAADLAGIWLLEGSGRLLRLGRDGTYALDGGGQLGNDPEDSGEFEADGAGGVTFTSDEVSRTCAPGDRWTWTDVRLRAAAGDVQTDPVLRGTVTGDDCGHAVADGWAWIRLSP